MLDAEGHLVPVFARKDSRILVDAVELGACDSRCITNNPNSWFDPLYNLIEGCLKLLKRAPATGQGMSQKLLDDNHKAYFRKYLLSRQAKLIAMRTTYDIITTPHFQDSGGWPQKEAFYITACSRYR